MIHMNEILFSYLQKNCPDCGSKLREYRRDRKLVRTMSGEFAAVHKIMICPMEKKEYRSERLLEIVPKRCRYSNDMMTESAIERFIKGKSCSEIAHTLDRSESHARKMSNQALNIFRMIHEESAQKLRNEMPSYILQIDGTVDAEFSMFPLNFSIQPMSIIFRYKISNLIVNFIFVLLSDQNI